MIACPRKFIVALAVLTILSGVVAAQEPQPRSITYRLSMTRPTSHLFEVSIAVELPDQLRDKPLHFQMAKWSPGRYAVRSEEHTSELQSQSNLVCRLLLAKKKK